MKQVIKNTALCTLGALAIALVGWWTWMDVQHAWDCTALRSRAETSRDMYALSVGKNVEEVYKDIFEYNLNNYRLTCGE